MEDYFGQIASIRDELAVFAPEYNHRNAIDVVICYRQAYNGTTYIQIDPTPMVDTVSEAYIRAFGDKPNIQIELDDYQIDNISSKYAEGENEKIILGSYYLIGATLQNGKPVGGWEAERIPGTTLFRKALTYSLLVRRRKPAR
jgi:hypothetical protein